MRKNCRCATDSAGARTGKAIAYWQLDSSGVPKFPLVNNTDSLYPRVTEFAYPKVGQTNSACRVGVVRLDTGETLLAGRAGRSARALHCADGVDQRHGDRAAAAESAAERQSRDDCQRVDRGSLDAAGGTR